MVVVVLIVALIVVAMFFVGGSSEAVLNISLTPMLGVSPTMQIVPPDYSANLKAEVWLAREFNPAGIDREIKILNGTRDILKEHLGCDTILSVNIMVYARNGSLIIRKTLKLDGGMERTIKIYRSDYEELQPLKVVIDVNLKLVCMGEPAFERNFHFEKDEVRIQTQPLP